MVSFLDCYHERLLSADSSVVSCSFLLVRQTIVMALAQSPSTITIPANGPRLTPTANDRDRRKRARRPIASAAIAVPLFYDVPAPVSLSPTTIPSIHATNVRRPNNRGRNKTPSQLETMSPTSLLTTPCSYSCSSAYPFTRFVGVSAACVFLLKHNVFTTIARPVNTITNGANGSHIKHQAAVLHVFLLPVHLRQLFSCTRKGRVCSTSALHLRRIY